MGILYSDDLDRFQIKQFKEAAKLRGTQVVFLKTLSEKKDIYTDIDIIPSEMPIYIDILFLLVVFPSDLFYIAYTHP